MSEIAAGTVGKPAVEEILARESKTWPHASGFIEITNPGPGRWRLYIERADSDLKHFREFDSKDEARAAVGTIVDGKFPGSEAAQG